MALKGRLRPILRRAREIGAFINFDMESYAFKDLTLALFRSILEEEEFRREPAVGIALQAYLRDCERDLAELIAWARKAGRPIVIRLVKGAYWDFETTLAGQRGWPVPVWSEKPESDANYEKLTALLMDNADIVLAGLCLAQRPLVRPRDRAGRPPRRRPQGVRVPGALRDGGRAEGGAGRDRPPCARVLPWGGPPAGHGLPRAQAP